MCTFRDVIDTTLEAIFPWRWNKYASMETASWKCNLGYRTALELIGSKVNNNGQSELKRGIKKIVDKCNNMPNKSFSNISITEVKRIIESENRGKRIYIRMPFRAPIILACILSEVDPLIHERFSVEKELLLRYDSMSEDTLRKVEVLIWKYLYYFHYISNKFDDPRFRVLMNELEDLE
ncbi:MAG TPA: hypothetical protein PK014_08440 [Thermoanaerobaculia bacterium]|nr:hypothetical protein [Thermoanaerobaculia bacterium]HUM30143.1 hypothetical protein [Thermoanaerobaculia bacterium]HXK68407.1 hypothetical protein [Thermoanaerobaculia bacterium]